MIDILLSHGYFISEDAHEKSIMKPYPTLGLLYISSYLKSKKISVDLFDSTFSSLSEFQNYIEESKPVIVGFYCNLMTKSNILKMISAAKRIGAKVIIGGPEPVNYKEEYLSAGADFIVFGEGELTLEELIPVLSGNVQKRLETINGIIYKNDQGEIIQTQSREQISDLSSVPWPDRESINLEKYLETWKIHHGKSSVSLITARGCPYTCTWCSHSVFGETHRRRTVVDVADEVEWIKNRYQPDMLWYADDVLTINQKWFLEYAEELKKRNIRIPFECISRADRLNTHIITALSEIGCYRLWIGAESGSQRILDRMQRKTSAVDVQQKTQLLKQAGIQVGMFIMLGYDGEKISDIKATIDHLVKSAPDTFLTTVTYPIKGTRFYSEVESRVRSVMNWEVMNDRDYLIEGRRSKRFYTFANRWLMNEVAFHQGLRQKHSMLKIVKRWIIAKISWLCVLVLSQSTEKIAAGTGWSSKDRAEHAW